jgi:3-oxoadipate enol-lactonase/4-carboxymuconolactone decarboxylase
MPTVEHKGAAISYRLDGAPSAPVLLLANSLGTTTAVWDDQVPALAQRFLVVRYDQRGHGDSGATPGPYSMELLGGDAVAVLDALDVRSASVAGLSLGGAVAMWMAVHAPDRVERLALCCTGPTFGSPAQWAERAAHVRASGVVSLLDALMGRWFTPGLPDRAGAEARVKAMLESVDQEGYAGCCEALATYDMTPELGTIRAPTLVLAGAGDPVVPPGVAFDLAARIEGSSLVVLADAAHLANVERPGTVTDALLAHLWGSARDRGDEVRRRVLGDAHVDRAAATATPETAGFQELVTRMAWGEVWTRSGLEPRTRSCITVAMLIALGRFEELALHLRGAERNGVTRAELVEVLLQSAVYCGFPAANRAFAVAREVFGADDG